MSADSLEKLKAVDYPVKISFDEQDKVYVAEFLDLPGCSAYDETVERAYQRAQEAKAEWLRAALEEGLPIPKPSRADEYSGRILLRLPASLHGVLADNANLHGASLNQYMVHLLSGAVVGDTVSLQLDDLRNRVAQLEWRIAQLSLNLRRQYAAVGTVVVSTEVHGPDPGSLWTAGSQSFATNVYSNCVTWFQNLATNAYAYSSPEGRPEQQMAGLVSAVVNDSLALGHRKQYARIK